MFVGFFVFTRDYFTIYLCLYPKYDLHFSICVTLLHVGLEKEKKKKERKKKRAHHENGMIIDDIGFELIKDSTRNNRIRKKMMQKYEITSQSVSTCIMILLHVFFCARWFTPFRVIYTLVNLHLSDFAAHFCIVFQRFCHRHS